MDASELQRSALNDVWASAEAVAALAAAATGKLATVRR